MSDDASTRSIPDSTSLDDETRTEPASEAASDGSDPVDAETGDETKRNLPRSRGDLPAASDKDKPYVPANPHLRALNAAITDKALPCSSGVFAVRPEHLILYYGTHGRETRFVHQSHRI